MKYCLLLMALFILLLSCSQSAEKKLDNETPSQAFSTTATDTSGSFLKKLLNSSPKEVAEKLGNPDKKITATKDCDFLPSCNEATYQNEKYEVLYYHNMLKWIEINNINMFNKNAIQYVGFPPCEPTLANEMMIHWRSEETKGTATGPLIPVEGIRQVSVLPADGKHDGYIIVEVKTNYDNKF